MPYLQAYLVTNVRVEVFAEDVCLAFPALDEEVRTLVSMRQVVEGVILDSYIKATPQRTGHRQALDQVLVLVFGVGHLFAIGWTLELAADDDLLVNPLSVLRRHFPEEVAHGLTEIIRTVSLLQLLEAEEAEGLLTLAALPGLVEDPVAQNAFDLEVRFTLVNQFEAEAAG